MANLKRAGSIVLALSLAVGGVPVVAWQHQAAPSAAALSQALRAPDLAAASGDSGKSAQAARAVRDPQRRVLALVQAAEAQSASGARDSAAATLREALGMAAALPVDTYAHAIERWILMSDIGAAQARAGDFDAALLSVAEISKPIGPVENLNDNEKESPIDRIYEEIARTHAGSHRYLKAELAMSKLANGLQKDAVLAAIGDAKAEEGNWDGAERTISFVGFLETRVEAMGLLARRLFKAGRADEAKLLIAEAVRTAEAAGGGPDGRAAALYRAVLARAEVDGPEAALQTAERIPGGWLDDLRFYWPWPFRQRAFVELRARVGDFAQAKASAREIPEAYEGGGGRGFQRGLAFRDIARAQASAHDFEAALETTAEIADPVGKAGAFIDIASARARAGGRVGVSETFRKGLVVMQAMPEAKGNVRFDKRPPLFKELARVQVEAGDEGVAEGWIGALDSPELKAWALAGLAEGMARRKATPK